MQLRIPIRHTDHLSASAIRSPTTDLVSSSIKRGTPSVRSMIWSEIPFGSVFRRR